MPGLESPAETGQEANTASTVAGRCGSKRKFADNARLLPIAFVSFTIFCLWFIYVFSHCVPMLQMDADEDMKTRGFWELVWFHYITGMLLLCYVQCIFVLPGHIPADDRHWSVGSDARSPRAPLNLQETKKSGDRRHCKWCNKYKPDRCHHCRVCKTCILKMDHHCPWIYNCVGFANYKYFFLLLVYATLACLTIVVTMFESLLGVIDDEEHFFHMFSILWGETLAFFMLALLIMFLSFHVCLIRWAMTTIEFCEKKMPKSGEARNLDSSVYDVGWYGNVVAVLGPNPLLWFLPCGLPKGDGINFVSDESRLTKDIESGRGTRRKTHQRAQRNPRPIPSESRHSLLSNPDAHISGSYPQPGQTPRM